MPNDLDVLKRMYATIFGGADRALTLLEEGDAGGAREVLARAMELCEELCIAGEEPGDGPEIPEEP